MRSVRTNPRFPPYLQTHLQPCEKRYRAPRDPAHRSNALLLSLNKRVNHLDYVPTVQSLPLICLMKNAKSDSFPDQPMGFAISRTHAAPHPLYPTSRWVDSSSIYQQQLCTPLQTNPHRRRNPLTASISSQFRQTRTVGSLGLASLHPAGSYLLHSYSLCPLRHPARC